MIQKHYISADELLLDSFDLAFRILESGYEPTHIAGIWRGGTPVGIAVQELLAFAGVHTDHIAIRTSLYEGIAKPGARVRVHGLSYLIKKLGADDRLLIVDDVYDSGRSMLRVIAELRDRCRRNTPEIRIATVYRKQSNALPVDVHHYFLHDTDRWLVFPHELDGLAIDEIIERKPGLRSLRDRLRNLPREQSCDD